MALGGFRVSCSGRLLVTSWVRQAEAPCTHTHLLGQAGREEQEEGAAGEHVHAGLEEEGSRPMVLLAAAQKRLNHAILFHKH